MQSLSALKAKLEEAKDAELRSERTEQKSRLKPYTDRFQRPGEYKDRSTNSSRNLTERRVKSHDSSASWRKKDSHFMRPDISHVHDEDGNGDDQKQDKPAADVKQHQVSRSSETSHLWNQARKPAESCNYTHVLLVAITTFLCYIFQGC